MKGNILQIFCPIKIEFCFAEVDEKNIYNGKESHLYFFSRVSLRIDIHITLQSNFALFMRISHDILR